MRKGFVQFKPNDEIDYAIKSTIRGVRFLAIHDIWVEFSG